MKLTDIIPIVLSKNNVSHAFGLQGGAVVHIFDSIERNNISVTYTLHEQAASLAAISYARINGFGCCVTTTGPGSTNALTGLLGAWNDSIPVLFVSGQVRSNHVSYGKNVRQVGTQEAPICEIVKPITKLAKFIDSPENFQLEIENAVKVAKEGRPGPVWIDIPLEYQWMDVPYNEESIIQKKTEKLLNLDEYKYLLKESTKPLLVLGNGIHLSRTESLCKEYIESSQIPFVCNWTSQDLFVNSHPLNLGVIGMSGQKGANKAVFEADLIICLGTHLSIPHTTTLYKDYAGQAKKILINIDKDQINNLNIDFDTIIHSELNVFFTEAISQIKEKKNILLDTKKYKNLNWYFIDQAKFPNSNVWNRQLTSKAPSKSCFIVDGGGTALYTGFQSTYISSDDQRIICSSGMSSMGTGLAETIGAFFTHKFTNYYCIIGDGSFFMNVQDLHTISQHKIPVIISVINNNGYLAIRHTQSEFQDKRFFGTHPEWGLTMPILEKIANGFDIPYRKMDQPDKMSGMISELMSIQGPVVCEVVTDPNQEALFKQKYLKNSDGSFSPMSLQDMYP